MATIITRAPSFAFGKSDHSGQCFANNLISTLSAKGVLIHCLSRTEEKSSCL